MAKHRMNKSPSKRAKTAGKLIGRRRRRISMAESIDGDSNKSVTSLDFYDDAPGDEFDYDGNNFTTLLPRHVLHTWIFGIKYRWIDKQKNMFQKTL